MIFPVQLMIVLVLLEINPCLCFWKTNKKPPRKRSILSGENEVVTQGPPRVAALRLLVITEVIANDHCFAKGAPYVVNIKFRNVVQKSWVVKLNGNRVNNLQSIIFEYGLIATITLNQGLYIGTRSYGDTALSITITSGTERKDITKTICVRLRTTHGSISTVKAAQKGAPVTFFVDSSGLTGDRKLSISFKEDGLSTTKVMTSNTFQVVHNYTTFGLFTYTWIISSDMYVAEGSGDINIVQPLGRSSDYTFQPIIEKTWPDNRVIFHILRKCGTSSPTSAFYRLNFGDGDIAQWQQLGSYHGCNINIRLRGHTYEQPGCYNTTFELRNPLGRFALNGKVNVNGLIKSVTLKARSIISLWNNPEMIPGRLIGYNVANTYPFNATAYTTGGRCSEFEWTILNPFWTSKTSESSIIISHLMPRRTGIFDLEVKVQNSQNSMTDRVQVILNTTLMGLSLFSDTTDNSRKVTFYVLVEGWTNHAFFNISFGDGNLDESRANLLPASNLPNITRASGVQGLDLTKREGFMREHTYTSNGMYNAFVRANDLFRSLCAYRSVLISLSRCSRPKVRILSQGDPSKLVFSIGETFTIVTYVNIDCDVSNEAVFRWTLSKSNTLDLKNNRISESDRAISFPPDVVTNQREITIRKRTIAPGIYIIRLTVSLGNLGYSDSDEKYLKINGAPIHVRINGGSSVLFSWENEIILNGSSSYDPNIVNGTLRDLEFKWYCKVKPGALPFKIGSGGCFGYGENLIEYNNPIWRLAPRTFIRNAFYVITLTVENRQVRRRKDSFKQDIEVRAGTVMDTPIRCLANCGAKIDPQMRLTLVGECINCGKFFSYNWTLHTADSNVVPLQWLKDTRTPQESMSFVLLPSKLSRSVQYYAKYTAVTPTGEKGYRQYGFSLSIPPYGGKCVSKPMSGPAIETYFVISCNGWKAESRTLKYSVSLVNRAAQRGGLKDDSDSSILYYGHVSVVNTTLPQGVKESDYKQELAIRIIDSYGSSTTVKLIVKVLPFTVKPSIETSKNTSDEQSVEDELGKYLYGRNSTLSKIIGSGDFQALGRLANAFGRTLDTVGKNTSASLTNKVKQENQLKREKMRETLIDSLTEVNITTLENFSLVSNGIKSVSSTESEVNQHCQTKMLKFYETTSTFMEKSYSKWTERDPQTIQDAVGGFLKGVGNMMDASALSRSTNKVEENPYHQFVEKSLKILDSSSSLLFQSIAPNEIARRVVGKAMTLEVKKLEGKQFDNMMIDTMGGGKIRSPSKKSLNISNNKIVDFKMVALKRNPFTWDKQSLGKMLTPTVTSVKLLADEKELDVQNMPAGDELHVEIDTPKTYLVNMSAVLKGEEMATFCNYLPTKGISVMAKTSCDGNPCKIYITYRGRPSARNYAETFTIEDSSESEEGEFKLFSDIRSSLMCIGVQQFERNLAGNSKIANKTVDFKLDLFLTGCFYWNKAQGAWRSDGCKISNSTTVNKTICLCNHLTWFGAGILVKPNVIDVTKETLKILDLDDYPALLATVCAISGIYLLAMIWARRRDNKDILKTGLTIAPDCCQTHEYRYDVTVYTGSRPYAGTTSSICIVLGGSLDKSEPHSLSSPGELFKRGNIDTFLVTSATNLGTISWLRIWIDNTGKNPTWFLSRVIVTDLLNNQQTTFLCHSWFGIGIADGTVDKTFVAAVDEQLKGFETIFLAQTSKGFCDDHLWFSVTMRPPRSHFTRCQRVTCCLCILLFTMLSNAMFYQTSVPTTTTKINVGSVSVSWRQIIIGIQSAFVVVPVNVLIVTLFRKAAPSVKIKVELLSDVIERTNSQIGRSKNARGRSAANKKAAMNSQSSKSLTSLNLMPSIVVDGENTTMGSEKAQNNSKKERLNSKTGENISMGSKKAKNRSKKGTLNPKAGESTSTGSEKVKSKSKKGTLSPVADSSLQNSSDSASNQSLIPVPVFRTYATESSFECLRNEVSVNIEDLDTRSKVNQNAINDPYVRKKLMSKAKKKKKMKAKSRVKLQDIKIDVNEDNDSSNAKKKKEKSEYWPHCCLYFAWFICVTACAAAAYFTLLYGLSFGKIVQEQWLMSFFTSVFQDVFVFQPAKVVIIGCIIAFIFKSLWVDEKIPEVELAKNDEWIKDNLPVQDKYKPKGKSAIPLSESHVKMMHLKRLKEIRLSSISIEIVVYLFYILLVLLIAYGHRSPNAYYMHYSINHLMISRQFDKVTNTSGYWDWLEKSFIPAFYGKVWYNGKTREENGFLADHVTYIVGSPMIRQLRIAPGDCPPAVLDYFRNESCDGTYKDELENYRSYGRGWSNSSIGKPYGTYEVEKTWENPWIYKSQTDLKSHLFMGRLSTYPGGGYVRTLGKSEYEAVDALKYLKKHLWIDSLTRAVFLEFTVYNTNDNFYSVVTLLIENTGTGGVFPFSQVVTTRLDRYTNTFSFFLAACEISFLLLSFYYMWLEIKKARRKGIKHLRKVGSVIEIIIFALTWTTVGLLIIRLSVVKWTKGLYKNNREGFTSFQFAASSDMAYGYTISAVVVLIFLKMLKVLRSNKNMLMLLRTLEHCSVDLLNFLVFFAIAFAAFMTWANLAFGRHHEGYRTFVESCMSIFNLLLGRSQFKQLAVANRTIAPLFFISFASMMNILLINVFLIILIDSFSLVRAEMADKPNKYDIFEFVFQRMMTFCPWMAALESDEPPRNQQKSGKTKAKTGLSVAEARAAKVDKAFNNVLKSEYEELRGFSQFALNKNLTGKGKRPRRTVNPKRPKQ